MSVTKAVIPIAIQPGTKLLRIERDNDANSFKLWIAHDRLYKYGTYLEFTSDGRIERVTVGIDNEEERIRVY